MISPKELQDSQSQYDAIKADFFTLFFQKHKLSVMMAARIAHRLSDDLYLFQELAQLEKSQLNEAQKQDLATK